MIRWVRQRNWLPEILLSLFTFFFFGGIDLIVHGFNTLYGALAIAASLIFIRKFSFLTSLFLIAAAALQIAFGLLPSFGSLGIPLVAFVVGAFSPRPWREINLGFAVFSGLIITANLSYNPAISFSAFGAVSLSDLGRLAIFAVVALLAISLITLMWILGLLLITRLVHVGTELDRIIYEEKQLELAVELAEQSKRFEIARDLNESLVQHLSSVITNAEGGSYAAKTDPSAGMRAMEKILQSAKSAHTELRRLFDVINRGRVAASAPPKLEDLESLAIKMRETGMDVDISSFGQSFALDASAELAIYRIVFDALRNAKQHNPAGTKATVELNWLESGMQVMIKDNGVEVERRAVLGPDGIPKPYDATEDLDTLLEKITGAGLTAMRERAESFGGSLEVQRVVGIGFTVSAMFPESSIRAQQHQVKG